MRAFFMPSSGPPAHVHKLRRDNMAEAADTQTTPVESGNPDTTPVNSGDVDTTPPEAAQTGNTQEPADIEKIVEKRLARAQKKWEAEREEAEKRARMDEAERLKAELADRDKAIAEAKAEAQRERSLRQLSGKVVDDEDALAIAERLELVGEDGSVDVEALLKAKPFLAPNKTSVGGSSRPPTDDDAGDLPTQIRKAEQAGDWNAAFRLKNRLHAQNRTGN